MRAPHVFLAVISLIAVAEAVTTFVSPLHGLIAHSLLFISMVVAASLKRGPLSNLVLSFSLAPLIRIIGLSMPLFYFPAHAWYTLTGSGVVLASIALIDAEGLGPSDVGLTLREPGVQALVSLTGPFLGIIEYWILRPGPIAGLDSPLEAALSALSLMFFTGFAEELAFRGIMQRSSIESLGELPGLLGTTFVFAIMHLGWLSALDLAFVAAVGLFFGYVVIKTGSILGASIAHGLTNIVLFIVMPAIVT